MSGGTRCKCKPAALRVTRYRYNTSAFNGYRRTPSDYSTVCCVTCGTTFRTKAAYVDGLPHGMPPGWEQPGTTTGNALEDETGLE